MELGAYLDKIYIIKSLTVPQGFNIQYHYAKWVSPRINELRFDRFIDIPFANITFVDAYVKGSFENGERFIDIGAAGFPSLLRVPFTALSANEFRFPSKNIDQNIRYVIMELLKNVPYLSMGEEMFRFLSGRQLPCLDNSSLVQAHVASLYVVVRDKVPLKCLSCKKFLWIELNRLPESPVQAKCPACSHLFQIQRPAGLDMQLNRFASPAAAGAARRGDLLLDASGEFRDKDFPTMPGPSPHIELDLDSILGPPSPTASVSVPAAASALEQEEEPSSGVEPGTEAEYFPSPSDVPAEAADVQLDDDFFQEILPDKEAIVQKKEEAQTAAAATPPKTRDFDPGLVIPGGSTTERDVKRCHVCQTPLSGGEKICPSCFSEVIPDEVSLDDVRLPTDSQIEIRLKDDPDDGPMPDYQPTSDAPPAGESAKPPELSTVWDERIWSVRIGDETYEAVDMKTLEEWIISQSVIETDLVRKGEAKWVEIGTVPYFRTAFKQVKEHVKYGGDHALSTFQPAPPSRRVIAFLIDSVICALLAFLGLFIVNLTAGNVEGGMGISSILGALVAPFIYLAFGNGVMGRTLGKGIMKMAVIDSLGKPIGLSKGMLRTLIFSLTAGLGFIAALGSPKRQALYDKVVDSYVVHME
jgi:uncharacterized RDD family membrane protein YckC